jgi:Nickel responsive protein SCO4226-like
MKKYVIERDIPGIGSLPAESYCAGAQRSKQTLDGLGTGIQWIESYVTADKMFCVYLADHEDLIRTHAQQSGFPATRIHPVKTILDPTSAPA